MVEKDKGTTRDGLSRSGPPVTGGDGGVTPGPEGKAHKPTKHDIELELEETRHALEAAEGRTAEYLESLQRMKAEFENYRKRMVREQTHFLETANADLITKLLPVLDDLELAVQHVAETDGAEGLAEGLRLVQSKFLEILTREGLEEINPEGTPFDPNVAEAMMSVPSADHEDCTVLQVLKKGYKWKGKLLRPAMVTVSQCPA